MRSSGCWTCRDRKVRCDEARPNCQRCASSNKICRGYGLKLSWPQPTSKRSIVGGSTRGPAGNTSRNLIFLNTGFLDMEIHRHLSTSFGREVHNESGWDMLALINHPKSVPWKPFQLQSTEMDLLAYFESVASNTLATFNHTRSELRSLLFRLALSDTTPSSKCVLWSILALSAAHQHRHQHQTSHLKLAVIQLLKSSSTNGIDSSEGVRHLAASMILSASEIHAGEDISSHWCWFLCGSGHLMRHILGDLEALGSDGYMLQDWVTYHGALLKFSLRHWHRMATIGTTVDYNEPRTKLVKPGPVCSPSSAVKLPETSHSFLKLLQDIFDGVLRPSDTGYHDAAYAESLQNLERRIQNISNRNGTSTNEATTSIRGWGDTCELEIYKLSLLIYLERVGRGFSSQSEKIALYAERAFAIFSQADCCELPFPLFIVGCEAQTDEQRMLIISLARNGAIAQQHGVRLALMLQAIWSQDDLQTEQELDYATKLDVVMTSNPYLPNFA